MTADALYATFWHFLFYGGLVTLVGLSLFVVWLMWAQSRAERAAWERQATRKLKAVRR